MCAAGGWGSEPAAAGDALGDDGDGVEVEGHAQGEERGQRAGFHVLLHNHQALADQRRACHRRPAGPGMRPVAWSLGCPVVGWGVGWEPPAGLEARNAGAAA